MTNTENTAKTIPKTTTEINIRDSINPVLSYQTAAKQFKGQIDYDAIWMDRPHDRKLLTEIVSIAVDVLTSTARTIRINREEKPVPVVQSIYRKLDKSLVEFVMDSITNCTSKAANMEQVQKRSAALLDTLRTRMDWAEELLKYQNFLEITKEMAEQFIEKVFVKNYREIEVSFCTGTHKNDLFL